MTVLVRPNQAPTGFINTSPVPRFILGSTNQNRDAVAQGSNSTQQYFSVPANFTDGMGTLNAPYSNCLGIAVVIYAYIKTLDGSTDSPALMPALTLTDARSNTWNLAGVGQAIDISRQGSTNYPATATLALYWTFVNSLASGNWNGTYASTIGSQFQTVSSNSMWFVNINSGVKIDSTGVESNHLTAQVNGGTITTSGQTIDTNCFIVTMGCQYDATNINIPPSVWPMYSLKSVDGSYTVLSNPGSPNVFPVVGGKLNSGINVSSTWTANDFGGTLSGFEAYSSINVPFTRF